MGDHQNHICLLDNRDLGLDHHSCCTWDPFLDEEVPDHKNYNPCLSYSPGSHRDHHGLAHHHGEGYYRLSPEIDDNGLDQVPMGQLAADPSRRMDGDGSYQAAVLQHFQLGVAQ
jgi:hypothetical protein